MPKVLTPMNSANLDHDRLGDNRLGDNVRPLITAIIAACLLLAVLFQLSSQLSASRGNSEEQVQFEGMVYDLNETLSLEALIDANFRSQQDALPRAYSAIKGSIWIWFSLNSLAPQRDVL